MTGPTGSPANFPIAGSPHSDGGHGPRAPSRVDNVMPASVPIRRVPVTGCCGFRSPNFVRHGLATDPQIANTDLDALTYAGNPDDLDPRICCSRNAHLR